MAHIRGISEEEFANLATVQVADYSAEATGPNDVVVCDALMHFEFPTPHRLATPRGLAEALRRPIEALRDKFGPSIRVRLEVELSND